MSALIGMRTIILIFCVFLCIVLSNCGSNNALFKLQDPKNTATNEERPSEDIPEDIHEYEPEDENIYIQEPVDSVPDYTDIEDEILSSNNSSKPDEDSTDKNNSSDQTAKPADKNVYTGRDYKGEAITKENLNFDGKTVTIMREWDPYQKGASVIGDKFIARAAELEKKYNVDIAEKKWKVNLAAEILSGTVPQGHLYTIGTAGGNIYDMADKGYISSLDDAMKNTGINMTAEHYSKFNTQLSNFNGSQWSIGVGFARVSSVILYNTGIMEEAGYNIPELISSRQWTWDKMTEIAKATTKREVTGEVSRWGIGMDTSGIKALILSNTGHISHPDENGKFASTIDSPNTLQALQQAYNWYNVDRVATAFTGGIWSSGNAAFANGSIAMYFADQTAVEEAMSDEKSDEYGLAYLPMGPSANRYVSYMTDDNSYVVPAYYHNITTEILLLADELHSLGQGYTLQDRFRDEWGSGFKTEEQYNMWNSIHFSGDIDRMWEGSDKIDLSGSGSVKLDSIISGSMIPAVWVETNRKIYTENAGMYGKKFKYTGSIR